MDEGGQEGTSTQWTDSDEELYNNVKCDMRWMTKYMDKIPFGKPDPNNGYCKFDLETHDRIYSVWF